MIHEKSGFWDSIDATPNTPGVERTYAAREMALPTRLLLSNGVDAEPNALKVSPGAYERSTQIAPGYAWIRGKWYALEDDGTGGAEMLTLLHDAPIQYNRIDRIILRYNENYAIDGQYIRAVVLKGMEAAAPVAPELTVSDEIEEISLARVLNTPAGIYILPANITDERDDEAVCGRARLRPGQDVTAHATRHAAGGSDPVGINTSQITGGTLGLSRGGTGGTDAAAARANLGAASAADMTALQAAETVYTTAGAAPTFIVADASVTAYAAGLRRTVQFHAAGTAATLNFNGKGAKALYEYTGKAMNVKAGQVVEVYYDGTSFFGVSVGGGVEFPSTPSAGDTLLLLHMFLAIQRISLTNSYANIANRAFLVKKACTLRFSYGLRLDSYNGAAKYTRLTVNGTLVPNSEMYVESYSTGEYAITVKTIDVTLNAGDVVRQQARTASGTESTAAPLTFPYFTIACSAADLQSAINEVVTTTT